MQKKDYMSVLSENALFYQSISLSSCFHRNIEIIESFTIRWCVLIIISTDQEACLGPQVTSVKEAALVKFSWAKSIVREKTREIPRTNPSDSMNEQTDCSKHPLHFLNHKRKKPIGTP